MPLPQSTKRTPNFVFLSFFSWPSSSGTLFSFFCFFKFSEALFVVAVHSDPTLPHIGTITLEDPESRATIISMVFSVVILFLWSDFFFWIATTFEYVLRSRITIWFCKVILMGSNKQQSVGFLETLKMERVRTILTYTYPYPHEHSRHAIIAVAVGCLFFISSDNIQTLVEKLDKNIKWWYIYSCLFGFFYFFSSPFLGKTIKPSYSNFSRWWVFVFVLSMV